MPPRSIPPSTVRSTPPAKAASVASVTPTGVTSPLPSAGIGRRLAALVYDGFLLFGLWVVPLFAATAALHLADRHQTLGSVIHDLPPVAPELAIQVYVVLVVIAFYGYFWRRNGQTLAMQAWRIRLDSATGGRPTWGQCLVRVAVGALSLASLGLGYFWLWWDPDQLTWHDRASRTRVVVLPKR